MEYKSVLHISNFSAKYRGNFIESLSFLDRDLSKKGIKTIYAFYLANVNKPELWMEEMRSEGIMVLYLTGNIINDSKLISKVIKDENICLIHTHFIILRQYVSIMLATILFNGKVIMHFHNHSQQAGKIKYTLRKWLYRNCYMIGCSESVYNSIIANFPSNDKTYIDNGIFFKRIDRLDRASRREYNLCEDSKVCLIFGFDFFRKGVDLAIQAIEQLNKEGANIELVVSLSSNFQLVEDNISSILGYIPDWVHIIEARNDVYMLYNMADIFLSPSREEGLPYSVIEAAYCRCNVVMSDISAQKYLKIPYGVWHQDGEVNSLKEAINKAINIGSTKEENLEMVRERIREYYSLERWSEQVEEVYKKNGLPI